MKTDTPKTDQEVFVLLGTESVEADFARELERENARLLDALRSEGDAEHARWVEAAKWKMRAEELERENARLRAFVENVREISQRPIDASDAMDDMEALLNGLSLLPNKA